VRGANNKNDVVLDKGDIYRDQALQKSKTDVSPRPQGLDELTRSFWNARFNKDGVTR
jgi:hypothetical protein